VTEFDFVNMKAKQFKLSKEQIIQLIKPMGGCYATDKITVDGEPVSFMYRESPDFDSDSGWRFLSNTESQEYADNPDNWAIYDVNTIANYDNSIIEYLNHPIGTELERVIGTNKFKLIT
jgi:hypothetical protein